MRDRNFLVENNAKPIWHPMAHPAEMRAQPPRIIMKGEGVHVTDIDGQRCSTRSAGCGTSISATSCDPIKKAIARPARRTALLLRLPRHFDRPLDRARAMNSPSGSAPEGMVRAFFTSGGSDSVEIGAAARPAVLEDQGTGRSHQIPGAEEGLSRHAFRRRLRQRQRQLPPQLRAAVARRVPHPRALDLSQSLQRDRSRAGSRSSARAALEDEIAFQGADTIAAFIMEPVLGAGGVIVPPDNFMKLAREICDRHGILMIADEVVTGFGRTGAWSGVAAAGACKPDMMTHRQGDHIGILPVRRHA